VGERSGGVLLRRVGGYGATVGIVRAVILMRMAFSLPVGCVSAQGGLEGKDKETCFACQILLVVAELAAV
jgi:hypothetical protein